MSTWTKTIRFNREGKPEATLADGTKIEYDSLQITAPYTPTTTTAPITTNTGQIIGWAHHTGDGWVNIRGNSNTQTTPSTEERTGTLTLTLETVFDRLLT